MFCQKCGSKLSDDAAFCGRCGEKNLSSNSAANANSASGVAKANPEQAKHSIHPTNERKPVGFGGWLWRFAFIVPILGIGYSLLRDGLPDLRRTDTSHSAPSASLHPLTNVERAELNNDEKAELKIIENAGSLADMQGHEINRNTRLMIVKNDFGEKTGCTIAVQGSDPKGGLVHRNWDIRVQLGKNVQNLLWTTNSLDKDAGEVRLIFASEVITLNLKVGSQGGRGLELNQSILNRLLSAATVKAVSGKLLDTELSNEYDLAGFKKAHKFASELCM